MSAPVRRPSRVLLVDDNANVRRSLSRLIELGTDSCQVIAVASGARALELLAEQLCDVALCDLALQGELDGIEVTRRIRDSWPEVKVVIFTGEVTEERKQEALDAGAFTYLPKPYKPEELLHVIQALVSIRRTESQTRSLETLARLATGFQSTFDFDKIARKVVAGARELGFSRARLYVFDEEHELLERKATSEAEELSQPEDYSIPVSDNHPLIQAIFALDRPAIWDRRKLEKKFPKSARERWIDDIGLAEIPWIDCPLEVEGRRVGTLAVDHRGEEDTSCTLEDLEIMGLYSVLVAQALHNSILYTQEALARASMSALLEDAPDAVITTDLRGTVNFASPSCERVTTWPVGDLIGTPARELYTDAEGSPDVGLTVAREIMRELRAKGDAGTLENKEVYIKARSGPPIYVVTSVSLLHDQHGEEVGTLAFLKNRSLVETEARRYRDLLEGFGYGLLLLSRGGRVEFVNPKAEILLGRGRGEIQGTAFVEALSEAHRKDFRGGFKRVLAGDTGETSLDLHVQRPDGTGLVLKARLSPTRSGERITGVTLALSDLEETAAIIRSGRLMALGEMVSGIAHEINGPLHHVSGAAHNLRGDLEEAGDLEPSHHLHLGMIERSCRRIADLVHRMKDFGSPSDLALEPLSLNALIEDIVSSFFKTRLRKHDIELRLDLEPDLPRVTGDRKRLQQVFFNLLTNAEQALESEEPPRRITIETAAVDRRHVRACVTDTGSGVPEKIRESIFDPFFTTRSPGGGTGLGLSICKSILDLHQGKIQVRDGPGGRGTTFHVILRRASQGKDTDEP